MHVVHMLYINVKVFNMVFFPQLFYHRRNLLYSSLFQILFSGAFISTSCPVVSALLRSLMSGTLGLILYCREQEKAGCASHRILWELWALGEENTGIERREENVDVVTGSLSWRLLAEEMGMQVVLESLIMGESDLRPLSFHEYDGIYTAC